MGKAIRILAYGTTLALIAATVVGHVRLQNPSNGYPLYWSSPTNIGIVINSTGSDDVTDGSDEIAIRLAIQDWNEVTGTNVTMVEDTSSATQARTDWSADDIHMLIFDENNGSGYFSGGSTVAITPVWFYSNGRIADADILFNGMTFSFTTSGVPGRFDIQDVAAHELGHLLGLDHSGWAGATMYPYVDTTVIEHRSLSEDEAHGLRDISVSGVFGRITGLVRRAGDSSVVRGAHVVARDDQGRTRAAILTGNTGAFTLWGLEPGSYTVYVRPLDEPVSSYNIGGGQTIEVDFEPAFYSGPAVITGGNTVALGVLEVDDDVLLNLGRNSDRYPIRVIDGTTTTVTVRGTGLFNGSTLEASDPDFSLGSPTWYGSQVVVGVTVPDGEPIGHVDLQVTNTSGQISILSAGLEVTPPSPTVLSIVPAVGGIGGGQPVTITGTEFHPGARVVIGDQIYTDGAPGGAIVVDTSTITLTTAATIIGLHDVVVFDPSGEEGRLEDGFEVADVPVLSSIFPVAGASAGGTTVTILGQSFQPGVTVRVDGVTQSSITYVSSTKLTFESSGGAPGGPYLLEVENPDSGLATSAFSYGAGADPEVTLIDPQSGTTTGGDTITVNGANFASGIEVHFGADPDTGEGGTLAAVVTVVDPSTLEVVTPAHTQGSVTVMVLDPATEQMGMLGGGFAFASAGGGGGGGCYTVPASAPPGPRDVLLGSWWALLLFLLLAARGHRARLALRRF